MSLYGILCAALMYTQYLAILILLPQFAYIFLSDSRLGRPVLWAGLGFSQSSLGSPWSDWILAINPLPDQLDWAATSRGSRPLLSFAIWIPRRGWFDADTPPSVLGRPRPSIRSRSTPPARRPPSPGKPRDVCFPLAVADLPLWPIFSLGATATRGFCGLLLSTRECRHRAVSHVGPSDPRRLVPRDGFDRIPLAFETSLALHRERARGRAGRCGCHCIGMLRVGAGPVLLTATPG